VADPVRIRTVRARRYVTPLREGGSLPAIIEADDDGLYVLKFRGAGQGAKALVAELLAGEVGRLLGLDVPEIVFVELPRDLARTEPDAEIQALIGKSAGMNLALDYLPGSVTFDPLVYQPPSPLASSIVWFDAYVCNVDRTARNANMLMWHRRLRLIDHGAALYFHHAWNQHWNDAATPFALIKNHALLQFAGRLEQADQEAQARLSEEKLAAVVELVPDAWLPDDEGFNGRTHQRHAYLNFFVQRLRNSQAFVREAMHARTSHL
jgi:hypothetical protein